MTNDVVMTTKRATRSPWLARAVLLILGTPIAALAIAFVLAGHPTLSHVEATLHPSVAIRGRMIDVTGTTDLPDGALLGYYFVHELASEQGQEPQGGTMTVQRGRFQFATDFTGWPGGAITLYVEFAVGSGWDQPQAVIDRFGADGELISGPQANSDSGDPPHLVAMTEFVLPAE